MDTTQRLHLLHEIGIRQGRYQSKFRTRHEPKTRWPKRIRRAQPWESLFMRKSRAEKREIVQKPWEYPMAAQNLAVILIQKRVRGMLCRLRAQRRQPLLLRRRSSAAALHAPSPMQRFVASGQGVFGDDLGFRGFTAARIQAWVRMHTLRWAYTLERFPVYHIAALQLQYAWKAHCQRALLSRAAPSTAGLPPPRLRAALRLQAAWRSYTNKRIFRYYRDLVAFQDAGDPATMLRAINPGEAALLDTSMGALVRFRLGGTAFPPTIYYKIFTRRAVCDVNAFSPKNYALARCQPQRRQQQQQQQVAHPSQSSVFLRVGRSLHRAKVLAQQDTRSWYQRLEHNGWRPVTAKVVSEASADPVARATAAKPAAAPALVRRQDAERLRRAKKRAWMRQLYAQGLLTETVVPDAHTRALVDVDFESDAWEQQADDMFQWAAALDFDGYVESWRTLGTTASSDDDPALAYA